MDERSTAVSFELTCVKAADYLEIKLSAHWSAHHCYDNDYINTKVILSIEMPTVNTNYTFIGKRTLVRTKTIIH